MELADKVFVMSLSNFIISPTYDFNLNKVFVRQRSNILLHFEIDFYAKK